MFLVMGVSQEEKRLDFDETTICKCCNKYGRIQVYMSYWYFMFFFIPLFKWNKSYSFKMTCCEQVGKLNDEVGKKLEKREQVALNIDEVDFNIIENSIRYCSNCGYTTSEDFKYCPKCSNKL